MGAPPAAAASAQRALRPSGPATRFARRARHSLRSLRNGFCAYLPHFVALPSALVVMARGAPDLCRGAKRFEDAPEANCAMTAANDPIQRRRTFAIISHPDAGKTTLTEKLLLFGGAIQLAGAVKARGDARRARSDWMKVERERGISVSSAVMSFEHDGIAFNLLDTPGHQDFSEDTYRTLTAVDSAVMVLDAAKGIEEQTRKLFEVCRLRDVPIITFVNKLDREGRDPFDLLDEIEQSLALDVTPASW